MTRQRIWTPDVQDVSHNFNSGGPISFVPDPWGGTGYAFRVNAGSGVLGYVRLTPFLATGALTDTAITYTAGYVQFWFGYVTKPTSGNEALMMWLDTAAARKASLELNSSGQIELWDSTLTLKRATGTTVLSANTWYLIQAHITKDTTGLDDGAYSLYVNGNLEFSGSNLNSINTNHTGVFLGRPSVSSRTGTPIDFYYKHFILEDAGFPHPSNVVVALTPNGAGNYTGATAGTWDDVDELPQNGDTNYLTWTSNVNRHSAALTPCPSDTIAVIQPYALGRDTGAGSASLMRLSIRSEGTDSDSGTGVNVAGTYTFFGGKIIGSPNPGTGQPWTLEDIDNLEVNARLSASDAIEHRCTSMGVLLEYRPQVGPITLRGVKGAAATSITLPAHQPGDMILIHASGRPVAIAPSAGGTVPTWINIQSGQNLDGGLISRYAIATASNHTSGTWTNATNMAAMVLRGTGILSIGGSSLFTSEFGPNTLTYPALTLTRTDGTSFGIRVGAKAVGFAQFPTPTGTQVWLNRYWLVTDNGLALHTSSALVANPTQDVVTTTNNGTANRAHTIEVLSTPSVGVATPPPATLTLTTFAPTVIAAAGVLVIPTPATLTLTTFAPTVTAIKPVLVTPPPATLTLTTFAPTVIATAATGGGRRVLGSSVVGLSSGIIGVVP